MSKSRTGEVITRTNKQERVGLGASLLAIGREKTYCIANHEHTTRTFERKKRNLIHYHHQQHVPEPIRAMQTRYDQLKQQLKDGGLVSAWCGCETEARPYVDVMTDGSDAKGTFRTTKTNSKENSEVSRKTVLVTQEARVRSIRKPAEFVPQKRTQVVSREQASKKVITNRVKATDLLERQFYSGGETADETDDDDEPWYNMNGIETFLTTQDQQQEAMFVKLRLDRWNTMIAEKERMMRSKYPETMSSRTFPDISRNSLTTNLSHAQSSYDSGFGRQASSSFISGSTKGGKTVKRRKRKGGSKTTEITDRNTLDTGRMINRNKAKSVTFVE